MRFGRELRAGRLTESRAAASAANDAVFTAMDVTSAAQFFGNRGFSAATIEILTGSGIVLPEELLFLPMAYFMGLSGLKATGLTEIRNYRKRFPPPREE
jgi:hypothetical protein